MDHQAIVAERLSRSEEELLREWYDIEVRQAVGGSAEDLVGTTGDLKKLFASWSKANLHQVLCHDWNYCAKRKKFGKSVELAAQLGEYIYSTLKLPVPLPFSLSVLIVMHGFDSLCECGE